MDTTVTREDIDTKIAEIRRTARARYGDGWALLSPSQRRGALCYEAIRAISAANEPGSKWCVALADAVLFADVTS